MDNFINHTFPDSLTVLLETFEANGYKAFIVGGSVRDILMGKAPHDYDVASNASPEEVEALFDRTIPTGIKHGTVTVKIGDDLYEVTRFRTDGEYVDNRHPESVIYVNDFSLDAARRDFTINAMGCDKKGKVYDYYGGREDLEKGLIKCVGEADIRFGEDALRILRCVRFASVLKFNIEENTLKSVVKNAYLLENVSSERVFIEVKKLLAGSLPFMIHYIINNNGLTKYGLESIKSSEILNNIPNNIMLRFTIMCLLSEAKSEDVLRGLKASKKEIKECSVYSLLLCSDNLSVKDIKQNLEVIGYDNAVELIDAYSVINCTDVQSIKEGVLIAKEENHPYRIEDLAITSEQLKALGYTGRKLGEIKKDLLDLVLTKPYMNDYDSLAEYLKGSSK